MALELILKSDSETVKYPYPCAGKTFRLYIDVEEVVRRDCEISVQALNG